MKHVSAFLALAFQGAVLATPMRSNTTEGTQGLLNQTVTKPTRTYEQKRNIFGDVRSYGASMISDLTSLPSHVRSEILPSPVAPRKVLASFVASAIQPALKGLDIGAAVQILLGINDDELAAMPTQVLQLPPYANWTNDGWNVRFHGNVYKQPPIPESLLNTLADILLPGKSISDLTPTEADMARNITASLMVIQQANEIVSVHLEPAPSAGSSGESGGGGGVPASGGYQDLTLPYPTTAQGDYNVFLPISDNGLTAGDATDAIQKLNVYANGTATLGNATAYLVPPTGLTIISDIDDILRVTKVYKPIQGLLNTVAYPYIPWMNMPDIYANWSASIPTAHFHYLTLTPEQITRNYMDFIYKTYPGGSFDTRPLNFSDIQATLSIRKFLLHQIFDTFPHRKFILVGDISNKDVMRAYPKMAIEFPGQVQCIFLRNVSATDRMIYPYSTKGFKNVNPQKYMFFRTPDDLTGLDIENGQCVNTSVPQHVTFGYQGLPFGFTTGNGKSGSDGTTGVRGIIKGVWDSLPHW